MKEKVKAQKRVRKEAQEKGRSREGTKQSAHFHIKEAQGKGGCVGEKEEKPILPPPLGHGIKAPHKKRGKRWEGAGKGGGDKNFCTFFKPPLEKFVFLDTLHY